MGLGERSGWALKGAEAGRRETLRWTDAECEQRVKKSSWEVPLNAATGVPLRNRDDDVATPEPGDQMRFTWRARTT